MNKRNIDAHVGSRLRMRRTMMGLSQSKLAEAIGITFQQVQKYEKGSNSMNANRLYEFSQLMQIPVSYFFEEIENRVVFLHANIPKDLDSFSMPSDRESLEIMKAFKRINSWPVRKRVADLVRAVSMSA
ncbi:MAG: helix-turn-helix transcriptional regulator [Pseudomonadota bacterium]|nr:helix-turn-helix transcriptional regulator [Pseudomonadota bacterium]MDE3038262.1 helix-turn-helix transcriptional regulator [Pseudomonadota bacterium]